MLEQILDVPHLATVVPRLPAELLHRVIERCGLEDCSGLVALATPAQLTRVFDLDLWRAGKVGADEVFDPDRFGVWLEVLVDAGASIAAGKLAGMDVELVVTGLAQHILVFDPAAVSSYTMLDGQEVPGTRSRDDTLDCEIAGYLVVAVRTGAWDAIVTVLTALEQEHPSVFHQVLAECRALSSSRPEEDGLVDVLLDADQAMFDVAVDREHRQEERGYLTPPQAHAFLEMARQLRLTGDRPPFNPIARAYFHAIDGSSGVGADDIPPGPAPPAETADAEAQSFAALAGLLHEAGVLPRQPRALLGPATDGARLGLIRACMERVRERAVDVHDARARELGFLANAIMAGCSIQGRAWSAEEAADAAVAVCNLGLDRWPAHWLAVKPRQPSTVAAAETLPEDFLETHDLVTVFQVGWTVLHDEVSMFTALRLAEILAGLRCLDRDTQSDLRTLRLALVRACRAGTPWRARPAMDAIEVLDLPAWATLLALIDECPVLHGGITARDSRALAVSATAFEFISEDSQILAVRRYMQSLPDILAP